MIPSALAFTHLVRNVGDPDFVVGVRCVVESDKERSARFPAFVPDDRAYLTPLETGCMLYEFLASRTVNRISSAYPDCVTPT